MKKGIVITVVIIALAIGLFGWHQYKEDQAKQKIEDLSRQLLGTVYHGADSHVPKRDGKIQAYFSYDIELREDHSCTVTAKHMTPKDNSWTTNRKAENLEWSVEKDGDHYVVVVSGKEWSSLWEDFSGGKISGRLEIREEEGEISLLHTMRNTYYDVYFQKRDQK